MFPLLLGYNERAVKIDEFQVFQVFVVTRKHLPFSSRSSGTTIKKTRELRLSNISLIT